MIQNLNKREQRFLIAGGLCILVYILIAFVIEPIYENQVNAIRQIENKTLLIKKYYEILNQKAYYEQKSKTNKANYSALTRKFLNQEKPALAAASLQKILENYAHKTSVNIESARIEKPKYLEKILAVPVEITIRSTLRNLTDFIYLVENHEKFMVIEEIVSKRVNKSNPEELQTRLLIDGFIQQLETEKPSKT